MKKLEKRAILCLFLAAVLFFGSFVYVFRYVRSGSKWAMFYGNEGIYKNGMLAIGTIYDRNGVLLAANGQNEDGSPAYNEDQTIRLATAHAVGDIQGNVSTGAESSMKESIVGYDLLNGVYHPTGDDSQKVELSISAEACRTAYEALGSHDGFVLVYNYETGEIVCMVSKPTFDPADPPDASTAESGTFVNKAISGTYIPGSTFKLLTAAAAIEKLDGMDNYTYYCTGTNAMNGGKITCTTAHGSETFEEALANSCNCAFADISLRIGASNLESYVERCGLTTVYDMDGVKNAAGSFEFPSNADLNLGWAGVGQWKDLVNPVSMLVYIGAIANDGRSVKPHLLHSSFRVSGDKTDRMIEESTAEKLQEMMKNNVEETYGASNYPGLDLYAKSGTAEVGNGKKNTLFAGFIKNENCPYAFYVCAEDGDTGASTAGPIARAVLNELVEESQSN